jgi:hypothetical protein
MRVLRSPAAKRRPSAICANAEAPALDARFAGNVTSSTTAAEAA